MNKYDADSINEFCQECHSIAVAKGFYDEYYAGKGGPGRNQGELIALIHSELSECLEALRKGNPPDKHVPDYSSAEVELADACIRIFDMAGYLGMNLGGAIKAKIEFNKTRPHKHGKTF